MTGAVHTPGTLAELRNALKLDARTATDSEWTALLAEAENAADALEALQARADAMAEALVLVKANAVYSDDGIRVSLDNWLLDKVRATLAAYQATKP